MFQAIQREGVLILQETVAGLLPICMNIRWKYTQGVSFRSHELLLYKYADITCELENYVEQLENAEDQLQCEEEAESDPSVLKDTIYRLSVYRALHDELHAWLSRIACLGFNTGKFDFNLIYRLHFPLLHRQQLQSVVCYQKEQ